MGTPARRVLFLASRHVARAHRPGVVFAAEADAEAALSRGGEAEAVLVEAEMRLRLRGAITGAEAEIRIRRVRVDFLARVELSVWIPGALELAKGLDELRAVHLLERPPVGLAVAVLPRKRAAVGEHELCGIFVKAAESFDSVRRLQVEPDPSVHAALSVVAEENAVEAVLVEELLEVAQVGAELLGRDRRVLEGRPRLELPRNSACADRRFAHEPDELLLGRVLDVLRDRAVGAELPLERMSPVGRFLRRFPAELDEQPGAAVRIERDGLRVHPLLLHVVRDRVVDALDPDRPLFPDLDDLVGSDVLVGISENEERPMARIVDQPQRRLERDRASRFGTDERARDMETALRQQLVEVVARDAARDLGVALADELAVAVADRAKLGDELGGQPVVLPADAKPIAAVGDDLEFLDVVGGARATAVELGQNRVDAARVVAEHAANVRVLVRGRVGPPCQAVLLGGELQVVADDAGLDARELLLRIDLEDAVQVLGTVDDHRLVRALADETGPATAAEERRPVRPANLDGHDDVVDRSRDDDPYGYLAVDREVGCVERSPAGVEANLALDGVGELAREWASRPRPHRRARGVP